ncbi:MAG: hypothetical protein JNL81_06925 [Hyphomonadaceae bacterium]|nr:hypothetical protein [Hyphomonadaceae bacterium]
MLELAAAIVVSAVALTFASDMISRAVKIVAPRRRGQIQVARDELSA